MLDFSRKIRDLIIAIVDWFYKPFTSFIPQETFRYAATGGMNTALDILLYFVFYNFIFNKQVVDLGFFAMSPHIAAFAFVFPITFTTGFLLAKYVTFTQSLLQGKTQLFRYGISVGGSIILNYLLLKLFVDGLGWYALISKIATTLIVILYSYMIQRHYTFKTSTRV